LIRNRIIWLTAFLFVSLIVSAFVTPAFGQVETWKIDPAHSSAQFAVRHLGISTVRGEFRKSAAAPVTTRPIPARLRSRPRSTPLRSTPVWTCAITICAARTFWTCQKYPTIAFKSKQAESAGPGKLKITGDLTIHGVAKEVVLDVDGPTSPVKDPRGNVHVGGFGNHNRQPQRFWCEWSAQHGWRSNIHYHRRGAD